MIDWAAAGESVFVLLGAANESCFGDEASVAGGWFAVDRGVSP